MPKASRWLLLRTRSGTPVEEALDKGDNPRVVKVLDSNQTTLEWKGADGDYVMARLTKRPVLVISQTCDIETKDWFAAAPIKPVESISEEQKQTAIDGQVFDLFYLPANVSRGFAESVADLSELQAVHKSYVKRISQDQHFRLSPVRTLALQSHVTRYFGRPNSFDARYDRVPGDGVYLCVRCFFMAGIATSRELMSGDGFPTCACGGIQWAKQFSPATHS
jgi:hypothetical protein